MDAPVSGGKQFWSFSSCQPHISSGLKNLFILVHFCAGKCALPKQGLPMASQIPMAVVTPSKLSETIFLRQITRLEQQQKQRIGAGKVFCMKSKRDTFPAQRKLGFTQHFPVFKPICRRSAEVGWCRPGVQYSQLKVMNAVVSCADFSNMCTGRQHGHHGFSFRSNFCWR